MVYSRARPCGISAIWKKMPHKIYVATSNGTPKNKSKDEYYFFKMKYSKSSLTTTTLIWRPLYEFTLNFYTPYCLNRPYSRYQPSNLVPRFSLLEPWERSCQPSLRALEDSSDKSNVTRFLRGQTSEKYCQWKKLRLSLFILDNRKWRHFHLVKREFGLELKSRKRARVLTEMVEFMALSFPFPS